MIPERPPLWGDSVLQFCICELESCLCLCAKEVPLVDAARGIGWTCPECLAGVHVLSLKNPASTSHGDGHES